MYLYLITIKVRQGQMKARHHITALFVKLVSIKRVITNDIKL
jgi:hypothetical protein